eukprot:COSAG05_NODE_25165_length_198_cov_35.070707_1_plen_53_part_01
MGIVNPLGYLLNDAPGSRMSLPRGPVGGGAFVIARRALLYVPHITERRRGAER